MAESSNRSSIIFVAVGVILTGALFAGLALSSRSNDSLVASQGQSQQGGQNQGEQTQPPAPQENDNQPAPEAQDNTDAERREAEERERREAEAREREQQQTEERERREQQEAEAREREERQAAEQAEREEAESEATPPPVASTGPSDRDDLPSTGPAEDFVMLAVVLTLVVFGGQRLIKSRLSPTDASKSS